MIFSAGGAGGVEVGGGVKDEPPLAPGGWPPRMRCMANSPPAPKAPSNTIMPKAIQTPLVFLAGATALAGVAKVMSELATALPEASTPLTMK